MRKKKNILLFLLGVTLVTTIWLISSSFNIRTSKNIFKSGSKDVFTMSNDINHPANKLHQDSLGNRDSNDNNDLTFEPNKAKEPENGREQGEGQIPDKLKNQEVQDQNKLLNTKKNMKEEVQDQNQNKNNEVDYEKSGPELNEDKDDNDNYDEDGLVDVIQFTDENEWENDIKACRLSDNKKYMQAAMHTPKGDVKIYIHNPEDDVHVSGSLKSNGEWEANLIRLIYSLLEKDEKLEFIDLGANIGVFSLAVAKLDRKVVAVEPLSINVRRLCRSIVENEFEDSITVVHNAVSDKHEKVRLGKEKGNVGGSFVAKDENVNKIQGSSVVGQYSDDVNTIKLDDLLSIRGIDLDKVIIKMDVEGWERHVLKSAERFFRKVDVQGVLMEWMWHKTGTDANDIISFFTNHGYEPVNPDGLQVLDSRTQSSWPVDIFWRRRSKSSHSHGNTHGEIQREESQSTHAAGQRSSGVKMYRRDMTKWNLDDSMCKQGNFMLASMHTPAGDVNINVHNPSADVHVSGSLLRDGAWEPHLIQLMFSLLQNNPSAQFIDLGANLGVFSLAVAKLGRRVIAVEPLSINLERFCKSIQDNNFQDRITVVTNALGNERENVSFGMDVGNVGGTFILNNKNLEKQSGSAYGGKYQDRVLTAKVDDFLDIPGFNFKNVVIKMDVEGYEHYVLQGASEFFNKVDVHAVLMEWMWHKAGSGSNQIFQFYSARGYEPFDPLRKIVLDTSNSQNWPVDILWRKKSATKVPPQQVAQKPVQTSVKMYRHDSNGWVRDTSMCIDPSDLMKANMHTNAGELTIYVHDPAVDIHVSGSLVRSGSWEDNLINVMYSLLSKDSGLQFIDLGANLGVYSLAIAKYGRRVLAAEPLSINLHRFCASISANHFQNLITVVTNALSDKREKVSFGKDQGNVGGTFVLNDKNMNKYNGSPVNGKYDDVVMSTFLDDVLELPGFNFKKAIMKMDVEGYEHHVLRAAENFFRTVDVQAILMEWMWQKDGSSAQEIIKFFTRHNYEPTSPGSDSILDTEAPGAWPVDVLWRRKASGKPSFRQNISQHRQPDVHNRQGNEQARQISRQAESDRKINGDGQTPRDERSVAQINSQRSTKVPKNDDRTVQQSQREQSKQVSHRSQYGVHFYRHEGESWVADDSSCSAREDFLRSNLHTAAGDVTIYIHDPSVDVHVSGGLQRDETWEPHLIRKMFELLSEDPKLQFIDFGANLGVFSLAVAKFGRRVLAAEPLSINLQRFCKSIRMNHLQEKITVVTNALSDRIENVSFGKDQGNIGGTFVLNHKNMAKYSGSSIGGRYDDVVQTAKIDSFLELPGFDFKKAIMKIDIEGYEHFAFRAAHRFFDQVDIRAVLMEWMWHKSGSESGEIVKFFMDRNYEPIDPNTNSKLEIDMAAGWPVDVLWRKMQKSAERYLVAKVPSTFKSGVQVYKHDMRQWVEDDSVCMNLPPMTKGQITNPMPGPYTIYVYEPSVDQYVSGGILQQGGWETNLVNVVLSFLQKDADLQFVDLGANLGVYTLAVAKIGREVIAVDPLTSNVQRMCNSIIDNRFGNKIKLVYNALSDKRGTVSLGKDDKNVGGTFVMDRSNANKVEGSNLNGKFSQDVITAKLDDLLNLPGFNFRKIIMKMDVEGYEGYVLNGGKKFFDSVDVQAVFMEWMWLKSGRVTQDVLTFFTSRGYKPYLTSSQTELSIQDATNWPVDMMWKKG